ARRLRADRERRSRRHGRGAGGAPRLPVVLPRPVVHYPPRALPLMAVDYVARNAAPTPPRQAAGIPAPVPRPHSVPLRPLGVLVGYGLWAIAGITRHDVPGNAHYYVVRQGAYVAVGVVGLLLALLIDPAWYARRWRLVFGGTVFAIAIVFAQGAVRGSKRWLDLGFFRFQPSEFGKVLFVVALAGFLAERSRKLDDPRTVLQAVGLAFVPIFLVFVQPDVGTAMVYAAAFAAILFVAGVRWVHLGVLAAVSLFVVTTVLWIAPAGGVHILKPYQGGRLTGSFHPTTDPAHATNNTLQSKH